MALSREEVGHIAALCRIGMTDEELDVMPEQLSRVLGDVPDPSRDGHGERAAHGTFGLRGDGDACR